MRHIKTLIRQLDNCTGVPEAGHSTRPQDLLKLGGVWGRLVSGVTSNTCSLHRVYQVVGCGLWNVGLFF